MADQSSQTIATVSAQDLLGSFGVNTHSGLFDQDGYVNAALAIRSLDYLGISTVRDNFRSDGVPGQVLQAMADAGIKFDFVALNTVAANGSAGVQSFIDGVAEFARINSGQVIAIEGQNEVDLFGTNYAGDTTMTAAIAVQKLLYTGVKANSVLADVAVYNLAMGREANYAALGDLSAYSDYANAHFYAGAASDVATRYANSVTLASSVSPREGYVVTETGFTTSTAATGVSVDELAQAKMTLTGLLMAYADGSAMSYVYQLLDTPTFVNTVASSPEAETAFGLFKADGSPKLAATTLHNFTSLLNASGGGAVNGTYQIQGLGSDGHSLSVDKAAGGSDLVIWRNVSSYSTATNSAVTVAPEQVTITFSSVQAHVYVYNPLNGLEPIASYSNVSSITLPVSDTPLVIELGSNHPYTAVELVASDPTLTIDTASFVAQIDTLSKTSGITTVNLTDSHTLEVASIETMKDIIANYGSLLARISGGYDFVIENVGTTYKIDMAYDKTGALVSTSNYTLAGGAVTALDVTSVSGATDHYSYKNGVAVDETHIAADGGRTTITYDGAGRATQRVDIAADGATTTQFYDAATGAVTTKTIFNADKSGDVWHYGITGKSYTSEHYVYGAGNVFLSLVRLHADGSRDYYEQRNADGSLLQDFYSAGGVITQEVRVAADGSRATTTYDSAGRMIQDITADKVTTTWAYDASGTLVTKTVFNADKSGDVWHYAITGKTYTSDHAVYSAGGALVSLTRLHTDGSRDYYEQRHADGSIVQDYYNAAGVITQEVRVAGDGSRATTLYDSTGRKVQDVSADKVTTTWAYDASGTVTTKTIFNADKSGDVWHYGITGKTYTSDHYAYGAGNVFLSLVRLHADGSRDYYEQRNADGSMVQDFYSTSGVIAQEVRIAADGSRATTTYDSAGRMIQDITADKVTSNWTYDSSGTLVTKTVFNADKSGDVWHYGITGKTYTSDHAVYAVGGALASLTRLHADGSRDYYEQRNADGSIVQDFYTTAGVIAQEIRVAADGSRATTTYDSAGRKVQDITADKVTSNWTYDSSGTLVTKTVFNADKSGDVWHYGITGKTYTSDHAVYAVGGALASLTRLHADGSRDYYEQRNADGSMLTDTYSATGILLQEIRVAADGGRITYVFDSTGRLSQRQDISATSVTTTWAYDTTTGTVATKTIANPDRSGMVWHYNITGKTYTSDQIVYSAGGSLYSVTRLHADGSRDYYEVHNSDGSTVMDYYSAAGVMAQEIRIAANGARSTYVFDSAGRVTQRQDISTTNVTTTWSYDSATGTVATKTITYADKSGDVWHYNITGKTYTSDHYVYGANNAFVSLTRLHADGTLDYNEQRKADGSTVKDYYNAAGIITQKVLVSASGDTGTRSYDTAGRLTTQVDISAANVTTIWTFDPATGDIKTKTVTNPDRSGEQFHYGITGQTYVSDHYVLSAGGAVQSLTRYHADGTLDYNEVHYASGGKTLTYYDAAGNKTLEATTAADGTKSFHTYAEVTDQQTATAKLFAYTTLSGNLKISGTPTVNLVDASGHVIGTVDASLYSIANGTLTIDAHGIAGQLAIGQHVYVDVSYKITDGTSIAPASTYSLQIDGTSASSTSLKDGSLNVSDGTDQSASVGVTVETISGTDGHNILDGRGGTHILIGGKGDDIYYVDDANTKVIELQGSGEGYDIVYSSASYALSGTFVEELRLSGSANINAAGNSQANTIRGNAGDNIINGMGGDDILFGGGGNDTFVFAKAGKARIGDFGAGDSLDLSAFLGAGKQAVVSQTSDGTLVTIDSGTSILIEGLAMSHLIKDSAGFHFG